MIEVRRVPAEHLEVFWPKVRPRIEKAIKKVSNSHLTPEVIGAAIHRGDGHLWFCVEGDEIVTIVTTEISVMPDGARVFWIVCVQGRRAKDCMDVLMPELVKLAEKMNCDELKAAGRRGWRIYAKRYGFTNDFMVSVRRLNKIQKVG